MGLSVPLLVSPSEAQAPSSAVTIRADIEALQRMYNEHFVPTFPGLYEIDRPIPYSPRETAPILVTRGGDTASTTRVPVAQRGDTAHLTFGDRMGRVDPAMAKPHPLRGFNPAGGNGPLRMLLLSAYDCPIRKSSKAHSPLPTPAMRSYPAQSGPRTSLSSPTSGVAPTVRRHGDARSAPVSVRCAPQRLPLRSSAISRR